MKLTNNFYLQEFVPRKIYERFLDKAVQFVDMRMVLLAQFYRDRYKVSITINNWVDGGKFNYRGFRDATCTQGADESQHRFGRAFDCHDEVVTPQEMYEDIMNNKELFYEAGLRCVEDISFTKTWLHSDTRETFGHHIQPGQILVVKP